MKDEDLLQTDQMDARAHQVLEAAAAAIEAGANTPAENLNRLAIDGAYDPFRKAGEAVIASDNTPPEREIEGSSFWELVLTRQNLKSIQMTLGLTQRQILRRMTLDSRKKRPRKPKRGGEEAWNEWRKQKGASPYKGKGYKGS